MASEVVSVNGVVMNSGKLLWVMARNREDERGTETDLGFGGGAGLLIGHQGRRHESWRGRRRCWRHRAISVDPEVEDDAPLGGSRLSDAYRFGMPGWLLVGRCGGLRPGKRFLYFFLLLILFLFSVLLF
jgi:hypothetical protein